ncbi:hypothetical protein [Bacillus toyonensis]|uniref:hypothetical protein n=1 Tax=Bacillus toyonensis TaxID=155322 RepID=UPI000BF229D7|nr:hypothetical protein [Bacillus toyonensis]PEM64424.1 hypothetical protein CN625_01555 [Bacillus toyonensis]
MEYKGFDTTDCAGREESLSIASWDNVVKILVSDNDGYYQDTYVSYETVRELRDYLTKLLESPMKGEKTND